LGISVWLSSRDIPGSNGICASSIVA
jgi:hypothetical protein